MAVLYWLPIAICFIFIATTSFAQLDTMNCRPKKGCKMNVQCDPATEGFNILEYLERSQFPLTCESKATSRRSNQDPTSTGVAKIFSMVSDAVLDIKSIKNELKDLRETNIGLNEQLTKAQEASRLFQMELHQLGDTNKNQSEILGNYRILLRNQNKDIKQIRGRSTELTVELMNLKKFKTDTEEDMKKMKESYEKQFDEFKETLAQQKEENEKLKESTESATKRMGELQTDYEVFREETLDHWEETSKTLASLTEENDKLKKTFQDLKVNGGKQISVEQVTKMIQEEFSKFQNVQGEESDQERKKLKKEITVMKESNEDQVQKLKQEYEDIRKEVEDVRKSNKGKIEKLEKEKEALEGEIRDLRNETEQYVETIQTMKTYLDEVKQKLYGFEEQVEEANKKIERFSNGGVNRKPQPTKPKTTSKITTTKIQSTTTSTTPETTATTTTKATTPEPLPTEPTEKIDTCQMLIDGICYWSEVHPIWDTNYETAVTICSSQSSVIADVPDEASYEKISAFLRQSIPIGWNYIQIWTATSINPPSGKLTPEDSYTKWYKHFPKKGRPYAEYTNIYLIVKRDIQDPNHGMANYPPTFSRNGVLCKRNN